MKYSVTARAYATVANQPTFDGGGFTIREVKRWGEGAEVWETLYDEVTLLSEGHRKGSIKIYNHVQEKRVATLSSDPERHTGGRVLNALQFPYDLTLHVRKGLSLKGTGLGSSGATPAATLKALEKLSEMLGVGLQLSDEEKAAILKTADFGVPDNSIPAYFGGLTLVETDPMSSTLHIEKVEGSPGWGGMVLVTPKGLGIKTEDTRRVLRGKKPPQKEVEWKVAMRAAFMEGDMVKYAEIMERAHQWFVEPRRMLYPRAGAVYDQLVNAAKAAGAIGVTISGSGPTLLALIPNERKPWPVAQAMCETFRRNGFDSAARAVVVEEQGAHIVSNPAL